MNPHVAAEVGGNTEQTLVGLIAGRQPLHLSVLRAVVDGCAAIDIVISQFGTGHHVLHLHIVAVASRTSAGDDDIGMELVDHPLRTKGGIHLADAALLYSHVAVAEQLLQLLQLLVHGYNYTYFHSILHCLVFYKTNGYYTASYITNGCYTVSYITNGYFTASYLCGAKVRKKRKQCKRKAIFSFALLCREAACCVLTAYPIGFTQDWVGAWKALKYRAFITTWI